MPYRYDSATLQPNRSGTDGLMVSSAAWPQTSGETFDKLKAWFDKPVVASAPSIKRTHAAIALAVVGAAWYAHSQRWF